LKQKGLAFFFLRFNWLLEKEKHWEEQPMQVRAIKALGKGFDLSSDFGLKFEKIMSSNNERLVLLDENNRRKVVFLRALLFPSN
jgi:hypothetical protein